MEPTSASSRVHTNRVLDIYNLKVYYYLPESTVRAVDGVSLDIKEGEIVGLIGESGSGKSTLGRSVIKLLPPYAKIVSGNVLFEGENLIEKDENEMRKIRGGKISMIFQNPTTALNPTLTVGEQIAEAIRLHHSVRHESKVRSKVVDILRKVGIYDAEERLSNYPYEFSAGMRQRVMIAMAISANPKLIIADEPTSALDVSIQARILELLRQLKEELKFSMILITHHIGVAAEMCDRIAIMYAGKIMEHADKVTILAKPEHPYTLALMRAVPFLHRDVDKLYVIKGNPPDLTIPPCGCSFHPRCEYATENCKNEEPSLVRLKSNHMIACFQHLR